uniref:proteasomal ubiquitin receptor ADRM1-like n=1 Tax=Styela clava TaxID=7725 RepID=UPI00193AA5A1|nr:proteasomal ubiquitin receptor ADRM1-like [Styela clava]
MALFANTSSAGGRSSSKNLVEFRAGKMFMKGTMVNPDKRKGLVYVHQSDDNLIHFCWKDRTSGKVEDDLIIFPDDCEFKRVSQCTTGRVYILKFKASSRKFFFWMQEPKTDKDEEHSKKVNDSLNNPPTPGQSSGGSDLSGIDQLGQGGFQDLLQNMDNNQLLQLMAAGGGMGNLGGFSSLLGAGGAGGGSGGRSNRTTRTQASTTPTTARTTARPATTTSVTTDRISSTTPAAVTPSPATPATPVSDAAASGVQLSQLQNILSQMGVQQQAMAMEEPVDLSKAITSDVMVPILANPEVQERLKPFLPQGESIPSTADELKATVKSPQFRQAMSSFSEALATGQLGPVLKQFGLPQTALDAAAKGDVEGFAKAMQDSEAKSSDSKKDEEEDMVVE